MAEWIRPCTGCFLCRTDGPKDRVTSLIRSLGGSCSQCGHYTCVRVMRP